MKTIQQLRQEYETCAIPPALTINETAALFQEIKRLENHVATLECRLRETRDKYQLEA
jgi:hypothetical protein